MNFKNMGASDGKDGRPPAAGIPSTPLPLARQSSVYSLTLDEFQSTLGGLGGKDFGSMNMDELLRNIWTAEESQAMASAVGAGDVGTSGVGGLSAAGLQRQGSLTLPRTLSQKTVDEVWKDLVRESAPPGLAAASAAATELPPPQQRQPTLGEMTLEEFLVRAGVVREDMNQPPPRSVVGTATNGSSHNGSIFFGELPSSNNGTGGLGLVFPSTGRGAMVNNSPGNLGISHAVGSRPYAVGGNVDIGNQQGMRVGGIMGTGELGLNNGLMARMAGLGPAEVTVATAMGSPVNQMSSDGLGKGNGDLSSLSPVPYVFSGGIRGRKCSGAVEKVVERRQRRMIKNRESAARSRARKQAYTMELEAEVAKLKEQNQELQKKQEEIMEMQKNQVLEMINQQRGPKKLCLRRTQTGPW